MEDEMHFSTEWGSHWTFADGSETWHDAQSRESVERMIANVREANNGIAVELVWRGVTPWMKALI